MDFQGRPFGNGSSLRDSLAHVVLAPVAVANAVNSFAIKPSATGTNLRLDAVGTDANIGIAIASKGSSPVTIPNLATSQIIVGVVPITGDADYLTLGSGQPVIVPGGIAFTGNASTGYIFEGQLIGADGTTVAINWLTGSLRGTWSVETAITAPNIPIADTGWTANADAGNKTKVIPTASSIVTIAAALDLAVSGAGTLLLNTAEKCKSLETALVALKVPNA